MNRKARTTNAVNFIGPRLAANLYLRLVSYILLAFVCSYLAGCATNPNSSDPWEPFNRVMFKFNEGLDKALIKPVAQGYSIALPKPIRTAITNFFSNAADFFSGVNNLLQGKVNHAASDAGRVLANTTLGLLGFIDVATKMGLEKHNEDFGQTLGKWGINPGPYLVLPLLGPTTVRDAFGLYVDLRLDPLLNIHDVSTRNVVTAIRIENARANLLDATKVIEEAALDRYVFVRDAYFQRRRNLVYDGAPPPEEMLEDIDTEPTPEQLGQILQGMLNQQMSLTDGGSGFS